RDRPSTATARVTTRNISFKPTSRRSLHAGPPETCPPGTVRTDGVHKASAQVAQVFGTDSDRRAIVHRATLPPRPSAKGSAAAESTLSINALIEPVRWDWARQHPAKLNGAG